MLESGSSTAARPGGPSVEHDLTDLRPWAAQNSYAVSERGRIPAAMLEALSSPSAYGSRRQRVLAA